MGDPADYFFEIALSMTAGIGPIHARSLIANCGNAEEVFREKPHNLQKIKYLGPVRLQGINKKPLLRAEEEITFIEKNRIEVLYFKERNYPERLRELSDAPIVLYYKGNGNLEAQKSIAIVGTRTPSRNGIKNTSELISDCLPFQVQVVSGLASGIDTVAHVAALECGLETIAVLGHGLDRIYPSQNRSLALKLSDHGGLLTEFPSKTKPDRENFPARNRIIAGLSDALVIIESGRSGGSMISAEFANNYNKDVFAIPGRIDDDRSSGCNLLIKSHKANLLESAKDIGYIMNWEHNSSKKYLQRQMVMEFSLDPSEKKLFEIIQTGDSLHFDELVFKSLLNINQVATSLLELEMKGLILSLPGKRFSIIK